MIPCNYHTHTFYCDGNDSPEALVQKAIELGCEEIGFSGHSFVENQKYGMSPETAEKYRQDILSLREKYSGKIKILLGIEQDYDCPLDTDGYDYVIGSVHQVYKNGECIDVDESKEIQTEAVNRLYNGDFYAFIEDYYKTVADVYNKTKCDIIGHFDLVTKFNEDKSLFDTNHPRYIKASDEALEKLLCAPVYFEINTGAISRGYRETPYPEPRLIEKIRSAGGRLIFSSDCHSVQHLLFGFEQVKNIPGVAYKFEKLK